MASWIGASGGKQRSQSYLDTKGLKAIDRNLIDVSGTKGLNNELLSQITEALRTGGIGAGLPIVQQSLSGAQQATSDALRGTQDSLAAGGLTRTPYGQSILAGQRMSGAQTAARIPTDYAQSFISQAPQFGSQMLSTILGALTRSTARSGPYST